MPFSHVHSRHGFPRGEVHSNLMLIFELAGAASVRDPLVLHPGEVAKGRSMSGLSIP